MHAFMAQFQRMEESSHGPNNPLECYIYVDTEKDTVIKHGGPSRLVYMSYALYSYICSFMLCCMTRNFGFLLHYY